MKIRYTPAAVSDLRELRAYLTEEFDADVASNTLSKIVENISVLKDFPGLMMDLSDKIHRRTKYKYCLCGKLSIAVLSCDSEFISVLRILDTRSDYASVIFE